MSWTWERMKHNALEVESRTPGAPSSVLPQEGNYMADGDNMNQKNKSWLASNVSRERWAKTDTKLPYGSKLHTNSYSWRLFHKI